MECPCSIEPHQIQGLDFIHIFPVVQWLVKKAIETREAEGDNVRKYALNEYQKEHNTSIEEVNTNGIDRIHAGCRPKRAYKRKDQQVLDDKTEVDVTMLEYGQRTVRVSASGLDEEKTLVKDSETEENVIDTQAVTKMIDTKVLSKAADKYTQLREHLEYETNPAALIQAMKIMEDQKETILTRHKIVQDESQIVQSNLERTNKVIDSMNSQVNELNHKVADQEVAPDQEELLTKLQSYVTKNELLKERENEYKEQCRTEMETLLQVNEKLEQELNSLKGVDQSISDEVDEESLQKRLEKLRKKLANVSNQVLKLERQVDAVPSPYELAQYQKRFVELENQVAAEYCETQQFVAMYNTLQDQLLFLEKEVKLLNSILDGIPDAKLSSLPAKQQFLNQLKQIQYGVNQSKNKVDQSFKDHQRIHDNANQELTHLLDLQQQYSILLRDMEAEIQKNETLTTTK